MSDDMQARLAPHGGVLEGEEAKKPGLLSVLASVLFLVILVLLGRAAYLWYTAPVRHQDYWQVPDRQPVPQELREAGQAAAAIEEQDNSWSAELERLKTLIDSQRPGEFDLAKELATTDAARAYVEKLLRLGEETAASFLRMQPSARNLDGLLSTAPAKYRAAAAMLRRYAEEQRYPDIKEDYLQAADVWEGKARAAARHQHEVREHLGNDILAYIKAKNVFLERFLTMLKNGLSADDLRETAKFRANLEELVTKYEKLREMLRTWRARLQEDASPPPVGPKPERGETPTAPEAAAPTPVVRRASWSKEIPAAPAPRRVAPPPRPAASSYWRQLREQEAAWEDKMRRLLATVDEKPVYLRDPRGACAACLSGFNSAAFDSLVRHMDAIERDMRSAQETARTFVDLLKRAPDRPPAVAGAVNEQDIERAIAAIRRGDMPEPGAATTLELTVGRELSLIATLLPKLHDYNGSLQRFQNPQVEDSDPAHDYRWLFWTFGETVEHAVEFQEELRGKLHAGLPTIFGEGEPAAGIPTSSQKSAYMAEPYAMPVAESPPPPPTPVREALRQRVIGPPPTPVPAAFPRPRVRAEVPAFAYRASWPASAAPSPATMPPSGSVPAWFNSIPGGRR